MAAYVTLGAATCGGAAGFRQTAEQTHAARKQSKDGIGRLLWGNRRVPDLVLDRVLDRILEYTLTTAYPLSF